MSEAILFALDTPDITTVVAATDFVEQARDNDEAPTAHIASFFDHLLQTWPEDGSHGHIWSEDFTHNQPTGALLELTLELGEFDEDALAQLLQIAREHGVHIFDPEGEVLYLADGGEATA